MSLERSVFYASWPGSIGRAKPSRRPGAESNRASQLPSLEQRQNKWITASRAGKASLEPGPAQVATGSKKE